MSKQANPTRIGVFIVVAVVIAFAGVLVLGSGRLFEDSTSYILYFESDLTGLDEGAPVLCKGVTVGRVSEVSIVYDHATDTFSTPVVIKTVSSFFVMKHVAQATGESSMANHIQRGLRARLETGSLITGKAVVSLDYYPDTQPVFRAESDQLLTEIPTVPRALDSIVDRISDLPLREIILDWREGSKGVADFISSGKVQQALDELNTLLASVSSIVGSKELQSAMASFDATLKETHKAMQDISKHSGPMQRELLVAIDEFSDAARSARYLLDYIERHPEALLRGKGEE
jgi:paraquat-inducible protein B